MFTRTQHRLSNPPRTPRATMVLLRVQRRLLARSSLGSSRVTRCAISTPSLPSPPIAHMGHYAIDIATITVLTQLRDGSQMASLILQTTPAVLLRAGPEGTRPLPCLRVGPPGA